MIIQSKLLATLFSDSMVAAEFSDAQYIRYLLTVEAALAVVQAKLEIIPSQAGIDIAAGTRDLVVNWEQLQTQTEKDGFPIIELTRQLREHVGGESAPFVHWGATTQDIMDTAQVLQIRASLRVIETTLQVLITHLAQLAVKHRHTLMAGRTHSQQALPIPFGFKVAGWIAPLLRHQTRLNEIKPRLLVVQFGGAVGTLASLGQSGARVQEALAGELALGVPLMPWHTQRDNLVEFAGWLSLVTGSLAKMAQDIILMAQTEIGELHETADPSRGGSSTMPQKSNPIISELIIATARTNASLLSAMHQSLIQEQERATHGWQMESLNLPPMITLTAGALNKALFLSENLVVDEARMRENVRASNGLMLAEALSLTLAPLMGRAEAKKLVAEACQIALKENKNLVDVVHEKTKAPLEWELLKDESAYFGSAQTFINRVLDEVKHG